VSHKVSIEMPKTRSILHKDVRIEVRDGRGKLGTLLISKGNIEWLASPKSIKKKRLTWKKFAALMADKGTTARAPRRKA